MLENGGLSRAVLSVVQGHRERHNGSGFPEGVRGDRIPLLAKVAGIAEFFESLIAPRSHAEPMTPAKAVTLLYEMRNIEFQEDLVENFIQAIGIYPTGSLVELTDGQRGIVVSHSPERRLWSRVMETLNRKGGLVPWPVQIRHEHAHFQIMNCDFFLLDTHGPPHTTNFSIATILTEPPEDTITISYRQVTQTRQNVTLMFNRKQNVAT